LPGAVFEKAGDGMGHGLTGETNGDEMLAVRVDEAITFVATRQKK